MVTLLRIHIPDQIHYHPKLELIAGTFWKSRSLPEILGECSNKFIEHLLYVRQKLSILYEFSHLILSVI